jgi:hypothetical protein
MLTIDYQKIIPYPLDVVYGQYYDYEHIACVHPKTLGEYRLVSTAGNDAVYEQIWPPNLFGQRSRSLVHHRLLAPYEMEFVFAEGRHRGIRVTTRLSAAPGGTCIDESYVMPPLPDWGWLRTLARPLVMRAVERVWQEDLDVEVCCGGWPGLPPFADGPGREVAA